MHRETVAGIATIFDSLWEESELMHEAESMRDIMTHDMRNFNRIVMSNAEILKEEAGKRLQLGGYIDAMLGAVECSSGLIEKTRILDSIAADRSPTLHPVDLLESVERSLALVRKANPPKRVRVTSSGPRHVKVFADPLLDQVFVNILSNAVRYTDGEQVTLDVGIERVEVGDQPKPQKQSYWKLEISDRGRGIPDDVKASAALRYMGSQTGRGLGLSVARALSVDRYSGRLELKDRVEGDYAQGTKVEIWLPLA